jgi:hypothetical protein
MDLFEVNGVPLRSQEASAMSEIYVCQEWTRANNLTSIIKLSEYLMGALPSKWKILMSL